MSLQALKTRYIKALEARMKVDSDHLADRRDWSDPTIGPKLSGHYQGLKQAISIFEEELTKVINDE